MTDAQTGVAVPDVDGRSVQAIEQNPMHLPANVAFVRRTDDFTAATVPLGLLKEHTTKAGTWGLIQVLEGALQYDITDARRPAYTVVLTPNSPPGIVEPTILHHITPLGAVLFHVEFQRETRPA